VFADIIGGGGGQFVETAFNVFQFASIGAVKFRHDEQRHIFAKLDADDAPGVVLFYKFGTYVVVTRCTVAPNFTLNDGVRVAVVARFEIIYRQIVGVIGNEPYELLSVGGGFVALFTFDREVIIFIDTCQHGETSFLVVSG